MDNLTVVISSTNNQNKMQITFLGACETVTGSKYLLEHSGKKILVDCGLFQGHKEMRSRNWEDFFIDPALIDAVILTHAHLDHSGYIPLLVRNGFRGKIFCSKATADLCRILLLDSGYLQEEDAASANRHGYSRHKPALPLYTKEDAENSLEFFTPIEFGVMHKIADDFTFELHRAGHILGSASVSIKFAEKILVFSGDLGRVSDPIVKEPEFLEKADYLVIESTYGNRLHEQKDPMEEMKNIINKTVARGGNIIIPAFAVGRAQNIMFYISQLKKRGEIPDIPVFLDSPMAIEASEILQKNPEEHKLGKELCAAICKGVHYARTVEESKELNKITMPKIIISASGMAEGGRILHHLKNYITDHQNTILFTGFQASGTRGAKILQGEREVKIHGFHYEINAEIVNLSNSSAHADYEEMLAWLNNFKTTPQKVFITHGSRESALSLSEKVKRKFGWQTIVPQYLQSEIL